MLPTKRGKTRTVPVRALYPVNDVSALMTVAPGSVWRTIYAGDLATVWLDGRRLVPAAVLVDYIRNRPDACETTPGTMADVLARDEPVLVRRWAPDQEFYTVDQCAVLLGISSRKTWELVYAQPARLRTKWVGARRLIPARVLATFIAELPFAQATPNHRLPTQRAA